MPRMSVKFNDKLSLVLEELQETTGKSKVEIIKKAIARLNYAVKKKKYGESLVLFKDGKVKQEILIP